MPVADSFGRQHVVIDQPDNRRATHAEEVGRLLCGERHGLRRDGHCLARMKCCHELGQGFVDRPGQLDAVVPVDTDQCVTGISRCAMTAFVSRQEPDTGASSSGCSERKAAVWTGSVRTGVQRLFERRETSFRAFETISLQSAVQHFTQQSRLASMTARPTAAASL
jgi:hypothetical protein